MDRTAGPVEQLNTSVYGQCLNNVIDDLQAMALAGIGDKVYFLKKAWHESLGKNLPCATVSYAPETSTDNEGPVNQSIVHYRVMVAMIWAANRDLIDNAGVQLEVRQRVSQHFRKTTPGWNLTGAQLRRTTVIAGEPLIREATLLNLDAQFLIIDCEVTEQLQ